MESVQEWGAVGDESLVAAALGGSADARAEIYRRYADRVHTMCVHMLSDRDEAADVCGQVFLVAFDRLGQLRDATRLRAWIFSITRHEVYRRTRRRRRIELIGEVERMDQLHTDQLLHIGDEADDDVTGAAELVAVVRAAADGLDDKDRLVLELQLQDLGGDEMRQQQLGTERRRKTGLHDRRVQPPLAQQAQREPGMRFGEIRVQRERPLEQIDCAVELAELVEMLCPLEETLKVAGHDNASSRKPGRSASKRSPRYSAASNGQTPFTSLPP